MDQSMCELGKVRGGRGCLTVKEQAGELDTDIAVPLCHSSALNLMWDVHGLELLDLAEDAVLCPEADDDLGHAEEEGLNPVFHEFSVKAKLVVVVADFGARLELHPVDRGSWCLGFRVPDLSASASGVRKLQGGYLLASTSPPRQTTELPKPVRTTEQYCSLLLTTSLSLFSMYSRDVSPHGRGIVLRVSNLYPVRVLVKHIEPAGVRFTPVLHDPTWDPAP